MPEIQQLRPGIHFVGAIDWDRRLFDSLVPLPDGTSYNSYLIIGSEKTALIDTVDPAKAELLIEHLNELKVKKIDYVVANHAEEDHSGSIPVITKAYPMAKVVTNQKCKEFLIDAMSIAEDRFITIADRQTLSLGNRTLEFIFAPWVHWPETMFTYLKEEKILFTCDFLGSHYATSDLYVADESVIYEAAKRYYAEIMMPFRINIRKHLQVIRSLAVDIVAPSHGPVYNKSDFILKAYEDWVSDNVKNEVVIPYVTTHGHTKDMVEHFTQALIERGVEVKRFELSSADIGKLAMALVDAATIVIGTPTILAGAHPLAAYAALLANALRPKTKFASLIGSYGWGGKMPEQITGLLPNLKVEILPPVIIKGHPREKDLKALEALADTIVQKHKTLGI